MTYEPLTIDSINQLLSTPSDSNDECEHVTTAVLMQLRDCLIREAKPKVIQLQAMDDNGIFALKSDGTIYHSMGGQKWFPFKSP